MAPMNTNAQVRYQIAAGTAVFLAVADSIGQHGKLGVTNLSASTIDRILPLASGGTAGTAFSYRESVGDKLFFGDIEDEPIVPVPTRRTIKTRFRRTVPLRYSSVEDESGFPST